MKLTLVTACFNAAATVAAALDSVASQTHGEVEHIVIDGASKDDTLALVRAHGRHVARVISEPDHGIYDAMNKGLRVGTGDVLGFLNADDLLAGTGVLAAIDAAFKGPRGADIVYGDLNYVSADDPGRIVRRWRSGAFHRSSLRYGWMPPHPTFYIRRHVLEAVGGFDTALRIAADYDFMMRCMTQPAIKVAYVPQVLVHMRMGGASNASAGALWRKSSEDLLVMRRHRIGGVFTLACKNLRKLPQFLGPFLTARPHPQEHA